MSSAITEDTKIVGIASNRTVTIDGKPLSPGPSQRMVNHSPTGFNWGYAGSGPAQLALAIMQQLVPDEALAQQLYQRFKDEKIVTLQQGKDFELMGAELIGWLQGQDIVSTCPTVETGA